jgi:hypothetical protein
MVNNFYSRSFRKDEDENEDTSSTSEPEYTFEGYSIEFNDKIVLTPVSAVKPN